MRASRRGARAFGAAGAALIATCSTAHAGHTNNILLTGYWPPTNNMIRPWNPDPVQNPDGWIGENWEGRGYDIYAYHPEFPGGPFQNPRGEGNLEVDYQDTSLDWEWITEQVRPVAIITFSRGSIGRTWEIEARNRKLPLDQWAPDYLAPLQPTPDLPIAGEPDNFIRHSSLPMKEIEAAVDSAGLGLNAYIDSSDDFGGTFLSEYIGYHGNWYHDTHAQESDPFWNIAAGHIHVGTTVGGVDGRTATEITLRELIEHVDSIIPEPGSLILLLSGGLIVCRRTRA